MNQVTPSYTQHLLKKDKRLYLLLIALLLCTQTTPVELWILLNSCGNEKYANLDKLGLYAVACMDDVHTCTKKHIQHF